MTFDLIVWPVDRVLSTEEAVAEIGRFGGGASLGRRHDKRLDPFIAEMERRYPGIRGRGAEPPPCEFDVLRDHVFLGIPWGSVEEIVGVVAEAAWRTGLAVFDPQREAVGLPAPFAEAPMSAEGVEGHVEKANEALAAIQRGAASAAGDDPASIQRAVAGELAGAGFRQVSPLGIEITPDLEAEVFADPFRMPSSLQTPERKAQLIRDLVNAAPGRRHEALTQLAAWDPDPEVSSALRPLLASDDVFEAGQAAMGMARQRDITDLPGLLDLVRRMSPADGGTTDAMLVPLRATLDLAALAGPDVVEGVKSRARTWRGEPRARRQSWERELDQALDELLGKQ